MTLALLHISCFSAVSPPPDIRAAANTGRLAGTRWCSWWKRDFISPHRCCFYWIFRLDFPQATSPAAIWNCFCSLRLNWSSKTPAYFSFFSFFLLPVFRSKWSYQFAQQITKTITPTWGEKCWVDGEKGSTASSLIHQMSGLVYMTVTGCMSNSKQGLEFRNTNSFMSSFNLENPKSTLHNLL